MWFCLDAHGLLFTWTMSRNYNACICFADPPWRALCSLWLNLSTDLVVLVINSTLKKREMILMIVCVWRGLPTAVSNWRLKHYLDYPLFNVGSLAKLPPCAQKIPLVGLNKNNHFNYYAWDRVQPQLRWQDRAEVALATRDGDEVWTGLQGNYRVLWGTATGKGGGHRALLAT